MPPAVIILDFDPVVTFDGWTVRWQVLAVAAAALLALFLAAWLAGRAGRSTGLPRLRRDDLLFLAIAAVPGAVIGGRLVHALAYLDYYATQPERIVDPAQGGLSLLGAVLGGMVSAAYMASLLGLPVRRWLDVAAVAVLVGIGLGKLSLVLGGEGQGQPFAGAWALAFAGDGPWYSPAPGVPAHPAQVYEALWNLAGALLLAVLAVGPVVRRLPGAIRQTGAYAARREARGEPVAPGMLRFGVLLFVGLAWFVVGRMVVGFAWKDDPIVGGLSAEQLMAAGVLAFMALYLVSFAIVRRLGDR
jgi:phosphatidylglycerol:prolipoprotein diacylglycerol transferase